MNVEAFVFLGIVLLVWFFASMGSWLREQLERYTRYQEELVAREASPLSPDSVSVQAEEATAVLPESVSVRIVASERVNRPARLRYRSRKAARRGVILMTVFGPCKALELRGESRGTLG